MQVRRPRAVRADPLLFFGVLTLLLVVVAAGFVGPLTAVAPELELNNGALLPTAEPTPSNTDSGQDESRELPDATRSSLPIVIFTIVLLACTFYLVSFLASLRRERLPYAHQVDYVDDSSAAGSPEAGRGGVFDGLALAEAELHGPADSRNAIVACWLALERATSAAGLPRVRQETTAEYAGRVLAAFNARASDIAVLQRLYDRARFGAGTSGRMTEEDLASARTSLGAISAAVSLHEPAAHHPGPAITRPSARTDHP
ncbi:hypothetical protein GCM10027404_05060 [Arthrobacter tumbae]|uniref:DUF4129 domain-containing protein n=1 Tax=Arthrobacter tumbae TaxID=163874 RepID=UPI0019560153|nr:DUF4129 domain-containing protein [Arthrobacter tumbae]MBM7780051.1 hypothetical protein [Arthrobacter tumbae]